MNEWYAVSAGAVCAWGAIRFLKLAADAVARSEQYLQLLGRQERAAARKRSKMSPARPVVEAKPVNPA